MSLSHEYDDENEEARRLAEELNRLRQETRNALESTWAEVERLQREGSDSVERLAELEQELQQARNVKTAQPPAQPVSEHTTDDDDDDSDDDSDISDSVFEAAVMRMNAAMGGVPPQEVQNSGNRRATVAAPSDRNADRRGRFSFTSIADTAHEAVASTKEMLHQNLTSALQIAQNDTSDAFANRRSSCVGRVGGAPETTPEQAADEDDDYDDDPELQQRIKALQQDKEETLKELTKKLRAKEAAAKTLQHTVDVQDRTLKELEEQLDELLREEVEEKETMDVDVIEREIEENNRRAEQLQEEVEQAQARHREQEERNAHLEAELQQITKSVEEAEQVHVEHIDALQDELDKLRSEVAQQTGSQEEMRQETRLALKLLRHDMVENMSLDSELVEGLWKQFEALQEKEDRLGTVLVARLQERNELADALKRTHGVSDRAAQSLNKLQDLFQTFGAMKEQVTDDESSTKSSLNTPNRILQLGERCQTGSNVAAQIKDVQERVLQTLAMVEDELQERISSLDWTESENEGENKRVSSGIPPMLRDGAPDYTSATMNIMERTEIEQEEARAKLRTIEHNLDRQVAMIDGKNKSEHGCFSKVSALMGAEFEDEVEDLERLETEIERRDNKVAMLRATAKEQEEAVTSLEQQVEALRGKTQEESLASIKLLEDLQAQVKSVVSRLAEKDRIITSLTEILSERKESEAALASQWEALRANITTDQNCDN